MKPRTYVTLVLDQSGSMSSTKEQAVRGYNEQVQQMKLNAKDQEIFCSLVTFSGEVFEHLWCEEASKLTEASAEDYKTEGSTAMRDAIGYVVEKLTKTTDTTQDNVAYLTVIISDGEENASKHYSVEQLREILESAQATGKWTFTYMGCNAAYLKKVAAETSIPISNCAVWSNATPELAKMGFHQNRRKLDKYYVTRSMGLNATECLYSADASKIADFTSGDTDMNVQVPTSPDVLNIQSSPITVQDVLNIQSSPMNANNLQTSNTTTPFKNYAPVNWVANS